MMGTTTIHQLQIPVNPYFSGGNVPGVGSCLSIQKEYQADAINQFIFKYDGKNGEFEYKPSSSLSGYSSSTDTSTPSSTPAQ